MPSTGHDEGVFVEFNYNGLWKILIDKGMLKKDFMKQADITPSTVAKMGKDKPVSMKVLWDICTALECDIGDIISITRASG